jgi:hypothetical protein
VRVDQPPQTIGAQWLTEFLRREGISEDRNLLSPDVLYDEPAQKSYKGRALIGIVVLLLAAGAVGAYAYQREILAHYQRWAPPVAVALNLPAPAHPVVPAASRVSPAAPAAPPLNPAVPAVSHPNPAPPVASHLIPLEPAASHLNPAVPAAPHLNPAVPPAPDLSPRPAPPAAHSPLGPVLGSAAPAVGPAAPHQEMLSPLGDPATALANFPQQPVDPPPTVMSNWAGALVIPTPLAGAPSGPGSATSSLPQSGPIALPTSPATTLAALPGAVTLPSGTPLYLRIVYTAADPAKPPRFDALTKRLRSQVGGIASVTASVGPAAYSSVDYFFPGDRAGASRVAASLARMTRRAEPLVLLHANPLPRPGTIEIRLTLRVGKELTNEGY